MWYVYLRHLQTGKKEFVGFYDNSDDAICKIASCYNIDKNIGQLGEYYYFVIKR